MELGDRVIVYTHERNDGEHIARDQMAFITGFGPEDVLDVVIFPPGGPVKFARVGVFSEDAVAGGTFWRGVGEGPPDFAAVFDPPAEDVVVEDEGVADEETE